MFKLFFKKKHNKEKWIIAGLGNIGPEYVHTRHNCGFDVIDILSNQYSIDVSRKRCKGVVGEGMIEGIDAVLVKPATYMNLSGECIRKVMDWYRQDTSRLIVIYDDIDIAPGLVRVRAKGSAGSHNGMKSVIEHIDTDEFVRIRIGIGKNPAYMDLAKYVLGHFTGEERTLIEKGQLRGAEAVVSILQAGCDRTMNTFNRGGK